MKPKKESYVHINAASIECCHYCVAPKRYPGCHGKCPEYLKEKAENEERKAAYYGDRSVTSGLEEQRSDAVTKAMKEMRRKRR